MVYKANQVASPILDAIDAGLIVLDRDRRIAGWNAWMETASGYSASVVHGMPLASVFSGADRGRLHTAITAVLENGMSSLLTHALHPLLFPLRTRSGSKMLHDVTVSAIRELHDTNCLIHVADVTMAVRRERYLRDRQNARYDAVVASAPDVILTLDDAGTIRHANPAAVRHFGYSEQELLGASANLLFNHNAAWSESWDAVHKHGSLQQPVELLALRKGGTLTYLELSASRWQNGSRVYVTAILRDINERRAAAEALAELNATLEQRVRERTNQLLEVEEVLRQSQKMEAIGQLTGGIAHDFNNLLQGIIGALNMTQKRVTEGRIGDVARFITGALSSAERASSLTHRLLAFSRRQPVDPRPVDVNALVASIAELLRRSIGETLALKIKDAPDLWLVRCDANQLENALLNLAINARDAMPDGGTMTISTSNVTLDPPQAKLRDIEPGEYVRIVVADEGVGMPPDVQLRAFDPFYTTKPIGQGTGLGLSMIYGFIRQSGGSVRIESKIDEGTRIEICLPRFTGILEPEALADIDAGDELRGANEVVLVVEDEDVVRLLVVEVLSDLGYRALEAADGASALRILQSAQRVDLLVTDIGLPDLNGRQVADAGREKRPALKILFMTGYAETAASSAFLGEDMQIISKPFTMDKLATKIREIVESR